MLLTTPSTLQDRRIGEYKGVVSGEAILGANAFRDMFAGIRDIVGGRSAAYERELPRAKDLAMSEMVERARETGANAVIGINLDHETVGQKWLDAHGDRERDGRRCDLAVPWQGLRTDRSRHEPRDSDRHRDRA
jgi:uncharacterized protein YbjQ (UPF0145 family)